MKRIRYSATLMLAILLIPMAALASDISGALFFGNIVISNNGTASQNVTSNLTGLNADNLIADGFMNATANNSVIRNASGADVVFQVGFGGAAWMLFVPAIGANGFLTNILYTAESTGGSQAYFPTWEGMVIADNASLEPSDNFSSEINGWINTASVGDNLIFKDSAFRTYVSANGEITSEIEELISTQTLRPNAAGDRTELTPVGEAANWETVDDIGGGDGDATYVFVDDQFVQMDLYNLPAYTGTADINLVTLYVRIRRADADPVITQLKIKTEGVEHTGQTIDPMPANYTLYNFEWATNPQVGGAWTQAQINALQIGPRMISQAPGGQGRTTQVWVEVEYVSSPPVSVTATGVTSGEHTVKTTLDGVDLKIFVDTVEEDSSAFADSVPANANDWIIGSDATLYINSYNATVGGNPRADIAWQYAATFTDQSGNGNAAVPNFAVDSSDVDITASLQTFQPVSEAKAPAFAITDSIAFIEGTGNVTGNFTTTPTIPGTGFPLAGLVAAVAGATTPVQLPLMMISIFVILTFSLAYSSVTRRFGSGSIFGKAFVIIAVMSIFAALGNFGIDFWMIVTFVILVTALAMASRQQSWA